jgi:hypothetical protein
MKIAKNKIYKIDLDIMNRIIEAGILRIIYFFFIIFVYSFSCVPIIAALFTNFRR